MGGVVVGGVVVVAGGVVVVVAGEVVVGAIVVAGEVVVGVVGTTGHASQNGGVSPPGHGVQAVREKGALAIAVIAATLLNRRVIGSCSWSGSAGG